MAIQFAILLTFFGVGLVTSASSFNSAAIMPQSTTIQLGDDGVQEKSLNTADIGVGVGSERPVKQLQLFEEHDSSEVPVDLQQVANNIPLGPMGRGLPDPEVVPAAATHPPLPVQIAADRIKPPIFVQQARRGQAGSRRRGISIVQPQPQKGRFLAENPSNQNTLEMLAPYSHATLDVPYKTSYRPSENPPYQHFNQQSKYRYPFASAVRALYPPGYLRRDFSPYGQDFLQPGSPIYRRSTLRGNDRPFLRPTRSWYKAVLLPVMDPSVINPYNPDPLGRSQSIAASGEVPLAVPLAPMKPIAQHKTSTTRRAQWPFYSSTLSTPKVPRTLAGQLMKAPRQDDFSSLPLSSLEEEDLLALLLAQELDLSDFDWDDDDWIPEAPVVDERRQILIANQGTTSAVLGYVPVPIQPGSLYSYPYYHQHHALIANQYTPTVLGVY